MNSIRFPVFNLARPHSFLTGTASYHSVKVKVTSQLYRLLDKITAEVSGENRSSNRRTAGRLFSQIPQCQQWPHIKTNTRPVYPQTLEFTRIRGFGISLVGAEARHLRFRIAVLLTMDRGGQDQLNQIQGSNQLWQVGYVRNPVVDPMKEITTRAQDEFYQDQIPCISPKQDFLHFLQASRLLLPVMSYLTVLLLFFYSGPLKCLLLIEQTINSWESLL